MFSDKFVFCKIVMHFETVVLFPLTGIMVPLMKCGILNVQIMFC